MEKRPRLTGKCALVTGSSTGIGRAIALRFAEEGASVAVNYSKSEEDANEVVEEIVKLGGSSISVRADVSKTQEVDTLVAEVVRRLGKVDILVNNAGVFIGRSLDQTSEDIWDKVLDTNLKGAFLCARRCVPEMLGVGRGKIINIASIESFISGPDTLAYCARRRQALWVSQRLWLLSWRRKKSTSMRSHPAGSRPP
jgi:3-oxoacyl-[acyl-carrier protein] reductase